MVDEDFRLTIFLNQWLSLIATDARRWPTPRGKGIASGAWDAPGSALADVAGCVRVGKECGVWGGVIARRRSAGAHPQRVVLTLAC